MYKSHELFATLSKEDRSASLSACVLPEKDEYTEDEMYRFRECLALREQGKSYQEIAQLFQQNGLVPPTTEPQHTEPEHTEPQHTEPDPQPQAKKSRNGKKLGKPLDISELLSFASEKCGTRIKLSEATEILASCGLPDTEEYTLAECDRFSSACDLIKNQGKSPKEVAAQFGIATTFQTGENQDATAHNGSVAQATTGENQDAAALIQEVNELLSQASSIQMQQIREMLPQLAVEQLQEIKTLFWQMTAQRLRQHMESGELEASIRTASSKILNGSGNGFGLLNQSQISSHNPRSLPGSSMNASTSE